MINNIKGPLNPNIKLLYLFEENPLLRGIQHLVGNSLWEKWFSLKKL